MSEETLEDTFDCPRCGAGYSGGDACPQCGALRSEVPCEEHPDRSAHSRCVICGRTVCAADGEGSPARCGLHSGVRVIEGWAQVYSTTQEIEAGLIAENLRAEEIDAQVFSQNDHIFAVDLGELSIVRVLVPVWEYAQALEIIRSYMDTSGEVVFACPSCGEVYEPGAGECTACGGALAGRAAPPQR